MARIRRTVNAAVLIDSFPLLAYPPHRPTGPSVPDPRIKSRKFEIQGESDEATFGVCRGHCVANGIGICNGGLATGGNGSARRNLEAQRFEIDVQQRANARE